MAERTSKTQGASRKPAAGKTVKGGKKKNRKKGKKLTAAAVFGWTFVAAVLAAICAMGVYIFVIINGNTILQQNMNKLDLDEVTHIYDASGNEVGMLYADAVRENVESDEIPKMLKDAFIATEDKRFNEHQGIDLLGIGRALVKDIVARKMVEGGSTITQQLAKNLFLNADKTFFRKATEMSIAVALEDQLSKDQILELYLNRIYFGNGAYGIKAASKVYFNQPDLNKLEIWQMATLAAMPKAPNRYNPINNPELSMERRGVVLRLMTDQGYINEEQRAAAAAVEYVAPPKTEKADKGRNQTYVDYVLREAQERYGLEEDDLLRKGYQIYTTIDLNAQKILEETYKNDKFFQKDGPEQKMQSSMVILNNEDGGIVAMIGGRDYVIRGLNRAADPRAARQPGSAFKPLVAYAPAIEKENLNPYSMLPDEKRTYNGYSPRNYDGVYRGQVTMMEAVRKSINAPAVYLLNEIGLGTAKSFLGKLGIELDPNDNNLAIALGGLTKGVTPLQMAQAYTAFPNDGTMQTAHAITKIVDSTGATVHTYKPPQQPEAMSPKTAWYMTQLMRSVVEPGGTGAQARFERPVAGKTGSTQETIKGLEKYNRDLWFVGYTPEWTAAVWMGFEKPDAKHYVNMSSGAPAALFKEVMQKSLAGKPVTQFERPKGVPDVTAPPKGISDLKAEYTAENRSVRLAWSSVGDNITYQLFRKDGGTAEFPSEPLLSTTTNEAKDISVMPGQAYDYAVVPVNPNNGLSGQRSNTASVEIPAAEDELQNPLDPLDPQHPGDGEDGDGEADPGQSDDGEDRGTDDGDMSEGGRNGRPGGSAGSGDADGGGTGSGDTGSGTGTNGTGGQGSGRPGGSSGSGGTSGGDTGSGAGTNGNGGQSTGGSDGSSGSGDTSGGDAGSGTGSNGTGRSSSGIRSGTSSGSGDLSSGRTGTGAGAAAPGGAASSGDAGDGSPGSDLPADDEAN